MLQTVRQNYEGYTKREVEEAKQARKTQAMMAHPTDVVFTEMVRNKVIKNSPVKPIHATNAIRIYSPELAGGRGRTTWGNPG